MSWRPIPQEICLANLSLKTPVVISATKQIFSSNLTKISCPNAKIFFGDIHQDTAFILKILCETYATKQIVKGNCLPSKFRMEISSKQIPKETSTKEYLEKHAYQKNLKRNLYKKNLKRKFSPSKKSNNFSTKNYLEKFNQENSEKTFPAKLKFEEQSLPKHLFQETFPYQIN